MIERFEGDKVIWMIVLLLMMFSVLSVFSSTSLLAQQTSTDRLSIVKEQIFIVAAGLVVIGICYVIRNIKVFEWFSKWGFAVSFALLVMLVANVHLGSLVRAAEINGARRILFMMGLQIHVYEIVKVAMVMYLAWAVNALKEEDYRNTNGESCDKFHIANRLASKYESLSFLAQPIWKKVFYIYVPILLVCALILKSGTSSALFIGGIMVLTIYIGGVNLKEVFALGAAAALYVGLCFFLYKVSDHKIKLSDRIVTAAGRMDNSDDQDMEILKAMPRNSLEFQEALDNLKQPVSALIAIKEGGILGKGPGRSTQRYIVPVIFGDYMFSFIVEEYGWWGALIIMILYASLIARGSLLAKNCENYFAKVALAGLIMMISAQAFMHIAINVHLVPQTGQTLPLISHGASSFLAFSLAFGLILSMSRMIHKRMVKAMEAADPILVHTEGADDVRDGLSQLEDMEDGNYLDEEM